MTLQGGVTSRDERTGVYVSTTPSTYDRFLKIPEDASSPLCCILFSSESVMNTLSSEAAKNRGHTPAMTYRVARRTTLTAEIRKCL